MKLREIRIHNFRCLIDVTVRLGNYGLLIGANNAGKSSVIDALRVAYGATKYEPTRDRPKSAADLTDPECWVDLEFQLTSEEAKTLKEEYLGEHQRLRVRRVLDSADKKRLHLYAFEKGVLSQNQFYGDDNVGQGKLGSILHIPAVSRVDDVAKFSGPSPLRELVNTLFKKLLKTSDAYKSLQAALVAFGGAIVQEKTADGLSLSGLEDAINGGLGDWGVGFKFHTNPLPEPEIVKSLLDFSLIDGATNSSQAPAAYGHGLQRHLIFTLLTVAANFAESKPADDKKDFSPDLTLILFEEPEIFLHPQQQIVLDETLRRLAGVATLQVVATSHSPNFVSRSSADLPSLCRIYKVGAVASCGQIKSESLEELFLANQQINHIADKYKNYQPGDSDRLTEMEALKYFMWLTADRSALFFAKRVLIVEGPTEVGAINYLAQTEMLGLKRDYFVLDAMGKFNIHRFMNLLGEMKIEHSVLHDGDKNSKSANDAAFHAEVNQLIQSARNASTRAIEVFEDDLESYLKYESKGRDQTKPTRLVLAIQRGEVDGNAIEQFVGLTKHLLTS